MPGDVIIVGGGLAGLVAACRVSELGLKAIVLEQGADTSYLCNTRVTGGVVHFAAESLTEPADFLADKVVRITDWVRRPPFDRRSGERRAPCARLDLGAGSTISGASVPLPRHQWVLAPLRMARSGLDPAGWKGRSGDATMGALTSVIKKRGSEIHLGTKARGLLFEGDRCVGVEATGPNGQTVRLAGRAVILADGGFQADDDLVRRFISKHPERVQRRNAGTGTGDAVRMLERAGAKLVGMKYFYGHLLSRDAMKQDNLWPYPGLDSLATAGIVVNSKGERAFDEGLGGVYLSNAIAWADDPLDYWVIFDEAIWSGPGRVELFLIGANPGLVNSKGTMFQADTLSALEQKAGFDVGAIERAAAAYNEAVAGGALASLPVKRSTHLFEAMPLRKPPFYAVPMCSGLTFTMGGAAVDENMRVLRADNSPISGLYAAGKSAGGLEGGEPVGYVGGLSLGLITGLRAAESIARDSQQSVGGAGPRAVTA